MKIGPDVWGPHGWKFIHMIALAYSSNPSEEQRNHYKEFFTVLQYILPCSLCANNYKRHITEELPLTDEVLKDRDSLSKWVIDIHNLVNKETGKKIIPYEEALEMIYNNYKSKPDTIESNNNMIPNNSNEPFQNNNTTPKVEFKKIPIKKSPRVIEYKDESSTFSSISFWLLIFISLVTIAIVYKKESL
jgi:hypothetical protein